MPLMSGIYDSGPIQPMGKVTDNLSIRTLGKWAHYRVARVEPIGPGPASTQNFGVIAANTTIPKAIVAMLQINNLELLHLRLRPLENIEVLLWELAGTAKFGTANFQVRLDRNTINLDPFMACSTFWILGQNRDVNVEVRNPMAVATPLSRVVFWGFKSNLSDHPAVAAASAADKEKLGVGDIDTVKRLIGPTTWLPAEGRA